MSKGSEAPLRGEWPQGPTRFEEKFGNNLTRIVVAVIGIPLVLGLFYLGGWWFVGFVVTISSGALLEFYWMMERKGIRPNKWIGVGGGVLYLLIFGWTVLQKYALAVSFIAGLLPVVHLLVILVAAIASLSLEKEDALKSFLGTVGGFFYIPFLLSTLIGLYDVFSIDAFGLLRPTLGGSPWHNLSPFYFFMILLVGIWICDSGAYFGGRAFGRRKLFERVSPKKTWEGAVTGALAGTISVGFLLPFCFTNLHWYDGVIMGLIAGIFGQIGDLAESHFKRACDIKDSSQIIPGHGGLLDRFDSLLFVAPATYIYFLLRLALGSS